MPYIAADDEKINFVFSFLKPKFIKFFVAKTLLLKDFRIFLLNSFTPEKAARCIIKSKIFPLKKFFILFSFVKSILVKFIFFLKFILIEDDVEKLSITYTL